MTIKHLKNYINGNWIKRDSGDLSWALTISEGLEYGIIGLNDGALSTAQAPSMGFKESGIEREGGHFGIEPFLETKYISIRLYEQTIRTDNNNR